MPPTWYPVFKVKNTIGLSDPHMPPGRFHHALFVENRKNGDGTVYHVIGDITTRQGMSYESKKAQDPEESRTFYSKELLGYTYSEDQPAAWDSVLSVLPTPPQQKVGNPTNKGIVEPFKEKVGEFEYTFYSPGEEQRPLWKCTEWIEWYAIPALLEHNLIQQES